MKLKLNHKTMYAAAGAVILILLILVLALLKREDKGPAVDVAEGQEYIAAEAAKDPAGVQERLTLLKAEQEAAQADAEAAARAQAERNELFANLVSQIETLNIEGFTPEELASYQQRFTDTVVVGDSMAQAVYENGLLDGNHVFFKRGASIGHLEEKVNEALAMLPQNLIFYTGLNDTDYFSDPNEYAAAYLEKVNQVKAASPSCRVFICSMLPPSNALGAVRSDLARAPEYDAALQALCESSDAYYLNLNWMMRQELYLDDGIHFNSLFYTVWMKYAALVLGV